VHQHPLAWAREHGAEFSPAKYDVLHLAPAASHVKLPETFPRIEGFIEKKEKELAEARERKEKDDARRQKGERVEKRKIGTPMMTIVGLTVQSNLLWDAHVKKMRQKSGQLVQNSNGSRAGTGALQFITYGICILRLTALQLRTLVLRGSSTRETSSPKITTLHR
jgi:hypothetical protein